MGTDIKHTPLLSASVFWDTDLQQLDFDLYADFTIIRVFERGSERDIQELIRYYGQDKIIKAIIQAKRLLPRAQLLGKKLFHLSNTQFECLKSSPQAPNYSMY